MNKHYRCLLCFLLILLIMLLISVYIVYMLNLKSKRGWWGGEWEASFHCNIGIDMTLKSISLEKYGKWVMYLFIWCQNVCRSCWIRRKYYRKILICKVEIEKLSAWKFLWSGFRLIIYEIYVYSYANLHVCSCIKLKQM